MLWFSIRFNTSFFYSHYSFTNIDLAPCFYLWLWREKDEFSMGTKLNSRMTTKLEFQVNNYRWTHNLVGGFIFSAVNQFALSCWLTIYVESVGVMVSPREGGEVLRLCLYSDFLQVTTCWSITCNTLPTHPVEIVILRVFCNLWWYVLQSVLPVT